jgi:hypothetical protein
MLCRCPTSSISTSDRTVELRVSSREQNIKGLVIGVIIPPHGTRANIELAERNADTATIEWRDPAGRHDIGYIIIRCRSLSQVKSIVGRCLAD